MNSQAVVMNNLTRDFPDIRAVTGRTLSLERGMIFGLLGPNGSGKTTALSMVSGLLKPTLGSVQVFGYDPIKHSREVRSLLGVVPQETALYEDLTALDNLRFHYALYCQDFSRAARDISEVLELIYLSDRAKSRVSTFSGGMKRRLALGRALLHKPELILFDEPTLGVDVQGTHVIWQKIKDLKDSGKTIIVTTNVMSEADRLCDEIAIMNEGRLVAIGTPSDLKATVQEDTIEIEIAEPLAENTLPKDLTATINGKVVSIKTPEAERNISRILSLIGDITTILRVEMRKPTLDDVFLYYTGRRLKE